MQIKRSKTDLLSIKCVSSLIVLYSLLAQETVFPFLIWRLNGCKIPSFSRRVCDFRWLIGRTQIELTQNVTSFHSPQFEITQILAWKAKPINSPRSGNHISRCRKILTIQGNPTIIFCKIAVHRSKYCLEFSITWGRLKISYKIRNLKFSDSKMWWREEPEKF